CKPDTSAGNWRETFISLRSVNFRWLWLGVLSMMGGMQMEMVARSYLAYEITSSALILGVVNAGFAVPMLALSLFGGAVADRLNKKRVIQVCQALAGLTSFGIALSISTHTVTWVHLFFGSFLNGIIFAFMVPSRTAIIPELVSRDMVTNALALNAAAMSMTTLLAPAFAGNLYTLLGPDGVYYLMSALEFTSIFFTGLIKINNDIPENHSTAMFAEIAEGIKYIGRNRLVIVLLTMALATSLLAMPIRYIMPIFVIDIYHQGPDTLGLLLSALGIGALLGSLGIAAMGRWRRGVVLILGGILSAIGLILLALVHLYLVAVGIMFLLGLGDSARRTLNMAMILEVVEDEYRGRVSSVYTMNFGLMPLGILPASIIAEYFGGPSAAATLGILLLAICLGFLVTQKRLRSMV
ncbi:MAG TPA: MFS transporter, partial [Spirochaetia bacterium]|nr:MFS transporter [Spirochaetia bacterium]